MKRSFLLSLILISSLLSLQASNVQVNNVSYTGDVGDPLYEITFDIAWENSWRTSTLESNYDAAWIFVKYKGDFDNIWIHGAIESVTGGGDAELILPSDGKGFFIQRSANGIGDVNFTNLVINWDLDFDFFPDEKITICIYAIEMVYIPEGAFELGDGISGFQAGNSGEPYSLSSEAALTLGGTSVSNLRDDTGSSWPDDYSDVITQTLPAAYPKGYQEFYAMKYEISQGQYAAFLNSITESESSLRYFDEFIDARILVMADA